MLVDMVAYLIERSQTFTESLSQHLYLTFISLGISVLLGVILGIVASRVRWLRVAVLNAGNIGRTIPSLAVLALALPLLGIGTPPTVLALVFIGTLPILINTTVGIDQVSPSITEAARGMGMSDLQVLLKVELPIATAVIMAGIRTSAVVVVASATLAGFIGGGGLGDLILRGHALARDHIMLAGAIPATLLALYFEEMFGRLENWATPKGLKVGEKIRTSGGFLGLLATVAVMPLIFGAMLPWETFVNAEGDPVVLTGVHAAYRSIGLPGLVLGLITAMWPRSGDRGQPWPISLLSGGPAVVGSVWMLVGLVPLIIGGTGTGALGFSAYLQLISVLVLAVIGILEAYYGRLDAAEAEEREMAGVEPAPAAT